MTLATPSSATSSTAASSVPAGAAPVLHYLFDPLCGWCYGAAPLVEAARGLAGLAVALHGGGMMTGPRRRAVTADWRDYVLPHDRRIAALTGQPFGAAYTDGLLRDTGAVMDSEPPTAAFLAAEALGGRGPDLLRRMQRAHYVEGRRIAEEGVLQDLAADIGLDRAAFAEAHRRQSGEPTRRHIAESRALLDRVGGRGFPTFALQDAAGRLAPIDIGPWLGRPQAWAEALARQAGLPAPATATAAAAAATAPPASGVACGPDGCALPG